MLKLSLTDSAKLQLLLGLLSLLGLLLLLGQFYLAKEVKNLSKKESVMNVVLAPSASPLSGSGVLAASPSASPKLKK